MKVGLVDCDLLDGGTNFPNLALMKISSRRRQFGDETRLVDFDEQENDLSKYDALFVSKVFTKSNVPESVERYEGELYFGGTGFFLDEAPPLDRETEHARPDYSLYAPYINAAKKQGKKSKAFTQHYERDSIGFTTRGCFRRCPFCVNKNATRSELWSPLDEFLDESRPYIQLLDDNVFACKEWRRVFDSLLETKKRFSFRQGLDLRLMDEEKARILERAPYWKDVYFAFDSIKDAEVIREKLAIYRRFCNKSTTCYLLSGYYETGSAAVVSFLDRLDILAEYDVRPYVMRFQTCYESELSSIWSGISSWCNQAHIFKRLDYFAANRKRSKKACDDAEKLLGKETVDRLKKKYWKGR